MNDDVQVLDSGQDTDTSTYTPYEMIEFENGTLVTPASADLETGQVTMPVYSGKAPINATNLNHLEQGLKDLETYILTGGSVFGGNNPIGSVSLWNMSTPPIGYLICDGTTYSKSQYPDLYDALGSDYQISAEQFKVPDFRGLIPIGAGTHQDTNSKSKTFNLNTEYGEYEHTLTGQEMPKHAHNLKWNTTQHEGGGNGSALPFNSTNTNFIGNDISAMIESGGSQSHNNIQPSLAVNFIIKAIKSDSTLAEVENSLASDSTTNAPSINAVNTALNKLGTRVQIFNGTGNVNTALTINTTWEALGKFKNLIVELNYTTNNNHTTVTFPFELLSGGINLLNSARTTNVYMPIVSIVDNTFGKIHLVPSDYVTSNTIKFDMFDESIKITRMWVEY